MLQSKFWTTVFEVAVGAGFGTLLWVMVLTV